MDPQSNQPYDYPGLNVPSVQNGTGVSHAQEAHVKGSDPAAELIRQKIAGIYTKEPDAAIEQKEAEAAGKHQSVHQEFIYRLHSSGKSPAEIQNEWHRYYAALPESEKHIVWQEFYSQQGNAKQTPITSRQHSRVNPHTPAQHPVQQNHIQHTIHQQFTDTRTVSDVKEQILRRVASRPKPKIGQHFQSLAFGLGMGSLVVLIMLFSFFNERFIAPFITPSRTVSSTPIIADATSTVAIGEPKVIIPKINVEIPVVYNLGTTAEKPIQDALEKGVVHYANTPLPGELGNSVIVGHSSNNILNQGKYKFAFVLLSRLEPGDTFVLTKSGKRYTYEVYDKRIVKPTEVSVLKGNDKPATATLITCDPPGTTINRLVVIGRQITPNPVTNVASTAKPAESQATVVPGDAPSLWQRIAGWFNS